MITEVEKMYENAGIGLVANVKFPTNDVSYNVSFPSFTAEKQIAILKLLTQQCDLTISHFTKWEFIHYDGQEPLQVTGKDFTETFTKLINAYWKNLTDKEKEQIKEILR